MQSFDQFPEFNQLPLELQQYFFLFFDTITLAKTSRVCATWNLFSNHNSVWLDQLRNQFNFNYQDFLASIKENMQEQTAIPPKIIYKFWDCLTKFYVALALEMNSNIRHSDFFAQSIPSDAKSFDSLRDMQIGVLSNLRVIPDKISLEIGPLLKEIYSLAEQHFEIASLIVSDGFGLNDQTDSDKKFTNEALIKLLIKAHINRFKTLDLTLSSFQRPANILSHITLNFVDNGIEKLILPFNMRDNLNLILFLNQIKTLVIHCDAKQLSEINADASFKQRCNDLLGKHPSLTGIIIRDTKHPNTAVYFEKADNNTSQKKRKISC